MSTTFIRKLRSDKRKAGRLDIVAECYKKSMPYRAIKEEVMAKLGLKSYSLQTLHADIKHLLEDWKEDRLKNTDEYVNLELKKIDGLIAELWVEYNKSKKKIVKEKDEEGYHYREVEVAGDVSYIAEIRQQGMERRKILGLYKPETKQLEIKETGLSLEGMNEDDVLAMLDMAQKIFDAQQKVIQI